MSTVNVAVTMQLGLTAVSISKGTGVFGGGESKLLLKEREAFDAPHYQLVQDYIISLYSPQQSHGSNKKIGVILSESATWEDPKCIFQGAAEIRQAFRIPFQDTVGRPIRCVNVEPKGKSIDLTFALPYQNSDKKSLLVATVEMHQMEDSPEFNEFLITKLEERWNGVPLFQSLLFWIVRRINGVTAFHFSSGLGW